MNMDDSDWIISAAAMGDDSAYEYLGHTIQFDGVDDYMEIPIHSDFEKSTLTWELWG